MTIRELLDKVREMTGKKESQTSSRRALECHGGPWDGQFHTVNDPYSAVEVFMEPPPVSHIQDPNLPDRVPMKRIGVYVVAKYIPLRGGPFEIVLRWKGEEIRNG